MDMYRFLLSFLSLLLFASCTVPPLSVADVLYPLDKTIPQVVGHQLIDNEIFLLSFSETVELTEAILGGVREPSGELGSTFRFSLPQKLEAGETCIASFTARKANGNTTRCSFTLEGVNDRIPNLLLNEVSTKGTSSSPDRIELLILKGGNTLGLCLSDGIDGNAYVLPSLEVKTGDLIVVYWNIRTAKTQEKKDDGRYTTWYLNANAAGTLSGNNGVLLLQETKNGKLLDALLYSDFSTTEKSGYGTVKGEKGAALALEEGSWSGEPVDSNQITSSRVFARIPGGVDSDSAGDWFVTAARKSTFGEKNVYSPYEEN